MLLFAPLRLTELLTCVVPGAAVSLQGAQLLSGSFLEVEILQRPVEDPKAKYLLVSFIHREDTDTRLPVHSSTREGRKCCHLFFPPLPPSTLKEEQRTFQTCLQKADALQTVSNDSCSHGSCVTNRLSGQRAQSQTSFQRTLFHVSYFTLSETAWWPDTL